MIKTAINRILELAAPNKIETANGLYVDKRMERIETELRAEPISVNTLSGLLQYLTKFAENRKKAAYIVHVVNQTRVEVISALDGDRERETLIVATAELPKITFGTYLGNEQMLIALQSMYVDDPETDRALLLQFAGTVTSGSVKEYGDDGVTQKATIRQGVASKTEAIVPSPCILRPYRTFLEVEQPASKFIFRMKEGRDGEVESALYEADGGAWKNEARNNIACYLQTALQGYGNKYTVIA